MNIYRSVRVLFNLTSQGINEIVDIPHSNKVAVAPDGTKYLSSCKGLPRPSKKQMQQFEFLGRKYNLFAIPRKSAVDDIKGKISKFIHLRPFIFSTPQGFSPSHQYFYAEGFCKLVVR